MNSNKEKGKYIALKRKRLGLTQKQLAEKLNITDKAVSKWETGAGFPDTSLLKPLASVLEITVMELLEGEDIEKDNIQEKTETRVVDEIEKTKKTKKKYSIIIAILLSIITTLAVFFPDFNSLRKVKRYSFVK